MSAPTQPKTAFFGATGGCTLAALTHTLRANIPAIALVRTPSKLTALLESQGLNANDVLRLLTIIKGNAHDVSAVRSTLTPNGRLVDLIVIGIGAAPAFQWHWNPLWMITLDDVNVCEKAAKTVMTALEQIHQQAPNQKTLPTITFISTTGVTRGPEDVPFWLRFLYHQLLAVPHADKKKMEDVFRDNVDGKDGRERLLNNVIGIRPTLLAGSTDVSDGLGWLKIRAGTENQPAMGYIVKRADVGEWMFKNVIESEQGRQSWEGQMVSLTS